MSSSLKEEHVRTISVPRVDVLVPKKPIKKYVEFGSIYANDDVTGSPDYVFRVKDLSSLIQNETELMGKEFPLQGFNFTAQIKCDVKYDNFQLSIRFLDPEKRGQPMDVRIQLMNIVTIIKNRKRMNCEEQLVHEFPFELQLVYGTFYDFCTLSFSTHLKNVCNQSTNSVTLHLHVRMVETEDVFLDDGVLLWKIKVTRAQLRSRVRANKDKELGLSPFFHVHPDGMRVQFRLLVENDYFCSVEARIVKGSRVIDVINFYVIHPTDSTRPLLEVSFRFGNGDLERVTELRYCCSRMFAEKGELSQYINEGKLLVRVEIN